MSINVNAARSEALFASPLQLSQRPTAQQLREAIMQTVRALGICQEGRYRRERERQADDGEIPPRFRWRT